MPYYVFSTGMEPAFGFARISRSIDSHSRDNWIQRLLLQLDPCVTTKFHRKFVLRSFIFHLAGHMKNHTG